MATYQSSIPRVRTDELGNIAEALPCISCGYNLYTLSPEGVCPECGVSVGRSVMGDYLRYCDPRWVKKLSVGTNMVVIGILITFLTGTCAGPMNRAIQGTTAQGSSGQWILPAIGTIAGKLTLVIGYFVLTARETVKESGGTKARLLARWFLMASFVMEVVNQFTFFSADFTVIVVTGMASALASVIGLFSLLVYCRQLAERVPDPTLVTHTSIVMWGWVIAIGGLFVLGLALGVSGPSTGPSGAEAAMGIACMGSMLVIVLLIWSLVLTLWYGRAFSTAAREARSGWARDLSY